MYKFAQEQNPLPRGNRPNSYEERRPYQNRQPSQPFKGRPQQQGLPYGQRPQRNAPYGQRPQGDTPPPKRDIVFDDQTPNKTKSGALASWQTPAAKASFGAAAVALGVGMAMKGKALPDQKYQKAVGDKVMNGMQKYISRQGNPLTRLITQTGFKVSKEVKRQRQVLKGQVEQQRREHQEVLNRIKNLQFGDEKANERVTQMAAESLQKAQARHAIEQIQAKAGNAPKHFTNVDPEYHMEKARQHYLKGARKEIQDELKAEKTELGKLVGTSILGGAGMGVGVTAIHALEDSLKDRKMSKKQNETYHALGSTWGKEDK